MNHRIEKLSTLLDENETQSNVPNSNEITIKRENVLNGLNGISDNRGCTAIKVEPLIMPKSKRLQINSSIRKHSKCDTCKKRFLSPSQLTVHKRIHLKQKRFTCAQCQNTFSKKSYLSIHQRMHTGEKPYSCDQCPNKFSDPSHLKCHKRKHS